MKQKDWEEILQVIQERLNGLDRADLADIDHYKSMYGRRSRLPRYKNAPIEKYLVLEILGAIYTDLYAGSPNLLNASMKNIRKIIKEGDHPKKVHIITEKYEEDTEDFVELEGSQKTKDALSNLRKIMKKLRNSNEQEKQK